MENVAELIHKELLELTTDIHKKKLLNSMKEIENRLDWIQNKANQKSKKEFQVEITKSKQATKEEKKIKKAGHHL